MIPEEHPVGTIPVEVAVLPLGGTGGAADPTTIERGTIEGTTEEVATEERDTSIEMRAGTKNGRNLTRDLEPVGFSSFFSRLLVF